MLIFQEVRHPLPANPEPAPLPFDLRYVPPSLSTLFSLYSATASSRQMREVATATEEESGCSAGIPFEDSSDDNNRGEKVGPRRSREVSTLPAFRIPPGVEILHGIMRLQMISAGRNLGYRGKLTFIRRSYTRMRCYCKNADLMSVFALFSTLGGTMTGSLRFQDIKEFIVYETGILVGNSFGLNQEAMMKFLSLFEK